MSHQHHKKKATTSKATDEQQSSGKKGAKREEQKPKGVVEEKKKQVVKIDEAVKQTEISVEKKVELEGDEEEFEFKRHRKRELVSNWHRYETPAHDASADESYNITDFNELLQLSKNESKYVNEQQKSTSEPSTASTTFKYDLNGIQENLFSINILKLNEAFKCIPFYENLNDNNEFVKNYVNNQVKLNFDTEAKSAINEFKQKYNEKIIEKDVKSESKLAKTVNLFDEIEQLKQLSLKTSSSETSTKVTTKQIEVKESEDLKELDNLIAVTTSASQLTIKPELILKHEDSTVTANKQAQLQSQTIDDWLDDVLID